MQLHRVQPMLLALLALLACAADAYIQLFTSSAFVQGNFGNRAAATAICVASQPGLCSTSFALVSYAASAASSLAVVAGPITASEPVWGANATVIAANWTALWAGTVLSSLAGAGITFAGAGQSALYYWTGTTALGATTRNCLDW